jgi:hypothetical protein
MLLIITHNDIYAQQPLDLKLYCKIVLMFTPYMNIIYKL